MMAAPNKDVFINCPFDDNFRRKYLLTIIFTIYECGFISRCALELDNAGGLRLDNIYQLIEECRFGLHDLTNVELDKKSNLPRFNMPFELGLFLAAKRFGDETQKEKIFLVLEKNRYELQVCLSDLAGVDPKSYNNTKQIIKAIRDWLNNSKPDGCFLPDVDLINRRLGEFKGERKTIEEKLNVKFSTMDYIDLCSVVSTWIIENEKPEIFVV